MEFTKIEFTLDDGVARITLNDAAHHNTVNLRFTEEFLAAAQACELESGIEVVLLAARGPAFSFGGDLTEFLAHRDDIQRHVRRMTANFHNAILTLRELSAPLVVAVQGMAAGGGFSLVCGADMAIAAKSAKFNFAYTRSGLTPDGGASYFLPRLVGTQRAFDIMATNPTLTASEAQALGIIARVVDDADLTAETEALIAKLRALPSRALPALKALLRNAPGATLEQQFEREAQSISRIAATPETLATLESFLRR